MGAGRLDGKVAIVTGGARGTGEASARRFAGEGAGVVVADVRDELGETVASSLAGAMYRHCDVSDEADWDALVSATVERFGRVDVLVNNAALLLLKPLVDTSVEEYERLFRVNELGPFLGVRAVAGSMTDSGGGSIVIISSIDGVYTAPFTAAYAGTKFAVRGLARVAALELGARGIRVNCVCPDAGNLDMVREALPEGLRHTVGNGVGIAPPPIGRHGTTDDVAAAALFFASDDSAFATGTDLVLDGGETAGWNLMRQMSR